MTQPYQIHTSPDDRPMLLALRGILNELAARGRKLRLGDLAWNSSTTTGALDDTGEQAGSHSNGDDR